MLRRIPRSIEWLASAALLLTLAATARAQSGGPIRFQITAGGTNLYKLAVPLPIGDYGPQRLAKMVQEVATNDLSLAGFFRVLDPKAYLANLAAEGLSINPPDWTNIGAAGVIKARVTPFGDNVTFEFRLYDVSQGNQPVLAKTYRGQMANARLLVHQWAADVVKYYTGEDSFFNSRIAFSGASGGRRRDLFVMDWDGAGVHAITNRSQNLMPAWSPSGGELAFTSYLAGKPDLYVVGSGGGRPRLLSARPGLNMGAAFSPDGREICATLSQDGNSELYLLSPTGAILKRLTRTPFIDTSCSWSPDGKRIAFVSDRFGSPQIWVMNADGSNQQRLTRSGNYNQTPAWSPKKDEPLIAFTARDEKGAYDIFTVNADTGAMVRITQGQGSNQHPSWAPNGRAIVYESSRGGVWISTYDGRVERQVYRGSAAAPAWGPALK